MEKLVLTGGYKPLDEAEICEFEQWLESKLPGSYRIFLLRNNGGSPSKAQVPGICYIQYFYGITTASESASLQGNLGLEKLPDGVIAIAYCGGGDNLCVSLISGKIYLWVLESGYWGRRAELDELTFVANDINAMLEMLEGEKPKVSDEEISNIGRWADVDLLDAYLKRGNDINALSLGGNALISWAVAEGNLNFVKACVQRGAILKQNFYWIRVWIRMN